MRVHTQSTTPMPTFKSIPSIDGSIDIVKSGTKQRIGFVDSIGVFYLWTEDEMISMGIADMKELCSFVAEICFEQTEKAARKL